MHKNPYEIHKFWISEFENLPEAKFYSMVKIPPSE